MDTPELPSEGRGRVQADLREPGLPDSELLPGGDVHKGTAAADDESPVQLPESNPRDERIDLLDLVTTISEAAAKAYYTERTIRRWVESGKVRGRKSGDVWLISLPSLIKHLAERDTRAVLSDLCPASCTPGQ